MGGSYYNSNSSRTREVKYKSMSREEVFTSRKLHDRVNPLGLKVREARDSEQHPNTIPIIIAFDVTGSMGNIPYNLIKNDFSRMMETLITNKVPDAAVCFCAIGDHYYDQAPLQVGQFESGDVELNDDLTAIWLEGGGGGQVKESYLLAWLFAARHTSTDAFEKRRQKGFLFTIGDEWNHPAVESHVLQKILGYERSSPEEIADQLLKEAQERWNVYHIHCSNGSYGSQVSDKWRTLLKEHLTIIDSSKIADFICKTVAISQGACEKEVEQSLINSPVVDTPQFLV